MKAYKYYCCFIIILFLPSFGFSRLDDGFTNKRSGNASESGFGFMLQVPEAMEGRCLPFYSGNPDQDLKRNGITLQGNPSADEKQALARGITQLERLLGEPLPKRWQTAYKFNSNVDNWRQTSSGIEVNRGSASSGSGTNIGRLMHELGHQIGNSRENPTDQPIYAKYEAHMKKSGGAAKCKMTGYCSHSVNEQFAEVFSAYITYPEMLQKHCPDAFDFITKNLFNTLANHKKDRPPTDLLASCSSDLIAEKTKAQQRVRAAQTYYRKRNPAADPNKEQRFSRDGRGAFSKTSSQEADSSGTE